MAAAIKKSESPPRAIQLIACEDRRTAGQQRSRNRNGGAPGNTIPASPGFSNYRYLSVDFSWRPPTAPYQRLPEKTVARLSTEPVAAEQIRPLRPCPKPHPGPVFIFQDAIGLQRKVCGAALVDRPADPHVRHARHPSLYAMRALLSGTGPRPTPTPAC